MNKTKNRDRFFIYIVIALIFSGFSNTRCARQGSLVGGPKDTTPPIVVNIKPTNFKRNFYPEEIMLEFNEFMQLKDTHKEIVFSPPLEIRPIVELVGKKVYTKFDKNVEFDKNTTYLIDYGGSLQDINEGNAARQLTYVFSTGNSIDSLSMSGQAIDAKTGDTIVNAIVMMYDKISDTITIDSTLYNGKVRAQFKTDSTGVYLASYLKNKEYQVYIFEDTDNNGVYTAGKDKVGFIDSTLNPAKLDPFSIWFDPISREIFATPQVTFSMFLEMPNAVQQFNNIEAAGDYKFGVYFDAPYPIIDTLVIDSIPFEALVKQESLYKDTTLYWIKTNGFDIPDTIRGHIRYMGRDTLGNDVFVDSKFEFPAKIFSAEEIKSAKKAARKSKGSIWTRILNWFRFKYNREQKMIRLAEESRVEVELLKLGYDINAVDSAGVVIPIPDSIMLLVAKQDTATLKIDSLGMDSLRVDSLALDTIPTNDSLNLALSISPLTELNPRKELIISTPIPIDSINLDLIKLYKFAIKTGNEDSFNESEAAKGVVQRDSTLEEFSFVKDTTSVLKYIVDAKWVPNAEYEFRIDPKAFVDIAGNKNDSITHVLKTVQSRDMAIIVVDAKHVNQSYIMEVVSLSNVVESSMVINKDSVYTFDLLPAESYRIKFTKDNNGNGVFDNGNLLKRTMPENIAFYVNENGESEIKTRKNFDYNIVIDVPSVFSGIKQNKQIQLDSLRSLVNEIQSNEEIEVGSGVSVIDSTKTVESYVNNNEVKNTSASVKK